MPVNNLTVRRDAVEKGLWRDGHTNVYHVDISIGARRVKKSTGTTNKKLAKEFLDRERNALWRVIQLGESARVTWRQLKDEALADMERRGIKTVVDIAARLEYITKLEMFGDRQASEITRQNIMDALAHKHKHSDGVSGATVNRYYADISRVLHYGQTHGNGDRPYLSSIPKLTRKELYPENDGRFRYLSGEEVRRLLLEFDHDETRNLHRMIRFSLATGMRQANVCGLRWRDIDMQRRTAWAWGYQTKNKKPYSIPINDDAERVLNECAGMHADFVFVYPHITRGNVIQFGPVGNVSNHAWYKGVARAGITDFCWHDLRHTWASWHVMAGTPLEVLQKLGGWSDLKMVLRYAHLSTSYIHQYAGNCVMPAHIPPIQRGESAAVVS